MPKCKYKNYYNFLEPHFEVVTKKDEFYEKGEMEYICRVKNHLNRLGAASFGNKKAKVKEASAFCQGCQQASSISSQTSEFLKKIYENTGHTVTDVNFSSRIVKYQCGNCGKETSTDISNIRESHSKYCGNCCHDKYKLDYGDLKNKVESRGFKLITPADQYKNNKQKLDVLCICGSPHQAILSDLVRSKSCMECKTKKQIATCQERYGVDNVFQIPVIIDAIQEKKCSK